MLRDIPLGNRRTEVGLELSKSWFLNDCLFNSEVWGSINEANLKDLNIIDHNIPKAIIGAQDKVPVEILYLETSQLPLSHVISVRRILYWHTLLQRHKEELTSQVYYAMKQSPLRCDWINLLKDDLEKVNLTLEDEELVAKFSKDT